MDDVVWKPVYATGIEVIDQQHKGLITAIQALCAATDEGALATAWDKLFTIVKGHFAHEERMMRDARFAGFAVHVKEHEKLIAEVTKLRARSQAPLADVDRKFFRAWLSNHILGHDHEYIPAMQESLRKRPSV